jgi:molybdopterin/thiamine biosynthesis adenylyltransferase
LQNEGYDIDIIKGKLIVRNIPYVNEKRKISKGVLVSDLDLAGDVTTKPKSHVVKWMGDYPCYKDGRRMESLVNSQDSTKVSEEVVTSYQFSQKPENGHYENYYKKIVTYVRLMENEARSLDGNVTSKTFPVIKNGDEHESVFCCIDTSSSRSGTTKLSKKFDSKKIAIVGLGGTGSYILDLVAKTPVSEIHLFDNDYFLQHNSFRSPGAPSIEDLEKRMTKVAWFNSIYSKFRQGIFPHELSIDASNLDLLNKMDFIFLCVDSGMDRKIIIKHLLNNKIPFIDTGIGLHFENGETLSGQARITTFVNTKDSHIEKRVPMGDNVDNEYSSNIQIAELNSLTAAIAVIRWKKFLGFYSDSSQELNTIYMLSENLMINEDDHNEKEKD